MGEVYRARDTRLDRSVAIKVLPEAFSRDPSLRQRLDLEARAISQLSHPHICTLHDIGNQDGTAFLVMELLDGETLADRLSKQAGRGLPLDEAIGIAIQIAAALAAAHRRGIVHRDLKPGNVMLTRAEKDGVDRWNVKLLDFGLAKLTTPPIADVTASAVTSPPRALTSEGTLLGTYQYMAPEQLEGRAVDARTDVFALGCVLYEMLTGTRSFDGRSPASIIAAILEREPLPLASLRPEVPPLVAGITNRCLAKDPDERWQSAADLSTALRMAGEPTAVANPRDDAPAARTRMPVMAAMALVGAAAFAAGAGGARLFYTPAVLPPLETRFEIMPPSGTTWSPSPVASTLQLALSPDGRRIAFVAAARRGVPRIWIRPLDSVQAQPLAGTDDAAFPFWSADGRSIGFFAGGKLKTIDTAGGAAQVLADARLGRGGSWNRDGIILFVPAPNRGIWRIPAAGGSPRQLTISSPQGPTINYVWPQFLADGRRFVFYQRSDNPDQQGIFVGDLESPNVAHVLRNDGLGVIAPGRLFFVRDGSLFAQPIDDDAMRPVGDAERMADGVGYTLGTIGYSPVSAASATLAYGPAVKLETVLQWRDRTGKAVGEPVARGVYRSPRLSPDGSQVLLTVLEERATSTDVSILDLARGTWRAVTRDPTTDWFPVWSARGDRVYFGAARRRATTVYERDLSGTGGEQLLVPLDVARYPVDATSDGRLIVQTGSSDGYDLGMLELNGDRSPRPLIATPINEVQGRVSPNRKWIAYSSDESGRFQVYVRAFPSAANLLPISPAGGMQPEWRSDGRELFYVSSDRKLMAVPVATEGDTFSAGVPRPLLDVDLPEPTAPFVGDYAVSADGQRFLLNSLTDQPPATPVTIVLNWASGLRP
jgi:Tol biopolymer transport system component/tRNA A-37 threonylcarbamoyl transferase component Bud32